jgi:hypothetical protein
MRYLGFVGTAQVPCHERGRRRHGRRYERIGDQGARRSRTPDDCATRGRRRSPGSPVRWVGSFGLAVAQRFATPLCDSARLSERQRHRLLNRPRVRVDTSSLGESRTKFMPREHKYLQ